ncbi:alpha/beta hydrolase [Pseudonocardia sp. TRM90224]|uniref:alpha/beta hydrolase n=1 Tax=Pseudonocardia sp. TRM90224 TaxID=2812678 RepID=UPI001E5D7AED|nr:alpha/beta hydrolase [Pseudonocardia sp. TRM90224]
MPLTLRTFLATAFAGVVTVSLLVAPAGAQGTAQGGGIERFLTQQLAWGPCAAFARSDDDRATFGNPAFDCTYLEVPLDYAHPEGRTAKLAMLRQKAQDPAARIGSLFTDPGGPGGSGVGFLPNLASGLAGSEVARRFDLIGFDPRGVGASEPVIDCSNPVEIDAERVDLDIDTSPAGVAQTEAEFQDFAKRCAERVGLDVLANVGTRDVARDLQIAYKVVGDQKLTYVGFSYGTQIGAEFAEQFPGDVRALVLDGAIDPSLGVVESRLTQARGFQRAFENFATACAKRPDCPLGTSVPAASAKFQELIKPLITKPVPAGATGRTLGYPDALLGTLTALYSETLWTFMQEGLAQVARGDGTNLLRLADAYYDRNADGSYGNLLEAFQVIGCADTAGLTDRAQALDISRQWNELAPFRDPGLGPSNVLEQCSFWPVPPTSTAGPVEAPGLPTVLVVSSTGDPATPYEDGVSLAKQLKARLLSVENDSHTVALQGSNACTDAVATRYLVDLTPPAQDTTCPRQPT